MSQGKPTGWLPDGNTSKLGTDAAPFTTEVLNSFASVLAESTTT
jgi:hypothetical protein